MQLDETVVGIKQLAVLNQFYHLYIILPVNYFALVRRYFSVISPCICHYVRQFFHSLIKDRLFASYTAIHVFFTV